MKALGTRKNKNAKCTLLAICKRLYVHTALIYYQTKEASSGFSEI